MNGESYIRVEDVKGHYATGELIWGKYKSDELWIENYMYNFHFSVGYGPGVWFDIAGNNDILQYIRENIDEENRSDSSALQNMFINFSIAYEIYETYGWIAKIDFGMFLDFPGINRYSLEFGGGYKFLVGRHSFFFNLMLGAGIISGSGEDSTGVKTSISGATFIATPQITYGIRVHPMIQINITAGVRLSPTFAPSVEGIDISTFLDPEEEFVIDMMGFIASLSLDIKI